MPNADDIVVTGYDDSAVENPTELIKDMNIIPLVIDSGEVIMSFPQKVEIIDNYVLVLDNNNLFEFDGDGNFLRQIGRNGHGEYLHLITFTTNNGNVNLIDPSKNSVLVYSINGDFIEEINAPASALSNAKEVIYANDDRIIISNHIYNDFNNTITEWSTKINTLNVLDKVSMESSGAREYIGKHPISMFSDEFMYIQPFSNIINRVSGHPIVIKTNKNIVPESKLSGIKNFNITTYGEFDDYFHGFTDVYETNDKIILPYFDDECTIVDKGEMTCKCYKSGKDRATIFPLFKIAGVHGNKIISVLSQDDIRDIVDGTSDFKGKDSLIQIQSRSANNYILIEVEL